MRGEKDAKKDSGGRECYSRGRVSGHGGSKATNSHGCIFGSRTSPHPVLVWVLRDFLFSLLNLSSWDEEKIPAAPCAQNEGCWSTWSSCPQKACSMGQYTWHHDQVLKPTTGTGAETTTLRLLLLKQDSSNSKDFRQQQVPRPALDGPG